MDPKVSFHFKHNKFHVTADASVVTIVDGVITINTRVSLDENESDGGPRVEVDDIAPTQAATYPPVAKLSVMEAVKQAASRREAFSMDGVYTPSQMAKKVGTASPVSVYCRSVRLEDPLPVVRVLGGGKTKYGFPKAEADAWLKRQGKKP